MPHVIRVDQRWRVGARAAPSSSTNIESLATCHQGTDGGWGAVFGFIRTLAQLPPPESEGEMVGDADGGMSSWVLLSAVECRARRRKSGMRKAAGRAACVYGRSCNSERAVLRSRRWFHLSALYYTEQDKDIHAEQTELPRRTTGERPPHAPHTAARRIHSEGRPARTQRTTGLLLTLTATATVGVQQRLAAPPRPLEDASRPPVGPYRQRRRSRLPPQPTLAAAQSSPRKQS